MNKSIHKSLFSIPVFIFLLLPLTLQGEAAKPPELAEMWIITVKDGMQTEFEKAFATHLQARAKAGDPRAWQVYTPHTGESLNHYVIRFCCFNWADRDAYTEWGKKSKITEDWDNNVDQYVANYGHEYTRMDHENSNWQDNSKQLQFVGVRSFTLKHGSDVGESVKAISTMAKDMKWDESWSWSYSVSGPATLSLVFPFADFTDMQPPEVSFRKAAIKHLGSEEKVDKMFKKFDSNFKSSEYTIYSHRPELSMDE